MCNENWKAGVVGLVALAAFGLICPLLAASRVPLVDPDEGLHASIAQEMVERGDWIVPRQLQQPFVDKPIFYFWAIAASLSLFGNSEAAVRLPGLLFGTLGTLTTALLAWRMLGRRTGLLAGVFYASMVLPLALVQLPTHDVALVPWVNLALLCLWEADGAGSREPGAGSKAPGCWTPRSLLPPYCFLWTAFAGVWLGLSILTKGMAGIVVVGIAYGGYVILARRLCGKEVLRAAWALSIALAIGSSWYIVVEGVQPGFLRYYFFQRHLLGFFTGSQPHGSAPWWYYLPILLAGGLPWIVYLPVLLRDELERRRGTTVGNAPRGVPKTLERHRVRSLQAPAADACVRRPLLLLGCWFVGCTLFLTASHSKLVTYIWPVFPAVAMLAAVVWLRKLDGLLSTAADRWMNAVVWATCLIGPFGLPAAFAITQTALPTSFSLPVWAVAVSAGLTSMAPLAAWLCSRLRMTVALSSAAVCGQLAVLLWLALPQAAETLSARDFARHFNRARVLPTKIMATEGRIGSIVFYLDRQLRDRLRSEPLAPRGKDGRLLRPLPADEDEERVAVRPTLGRFE